MEIAIYAAKLRFSELVAATQAPREGHHQVRGAGGGTRCLSQKEAGRYQLFRGWHDAATLGAHGRSARHQEGNDRGSLSPSGALGMSPWVFTSASAKSSVERVHGLAQSALESLQGALSSGQQVGIHGACDRAGYHSSDQRLGHVVADFLGEGCHGFFHQIFIPAWVLLVRWPRLAEASCRRHVDWLTCDRRLDHSL